MKRVNGFVDLNDLDTRYIKKSTYANTHYWISLEGSSYYYKNTLNPYHEVICSELAKMLNINCADYDLAKYKNTYGVISKSYRKENANYVSGKEILKRYLKEERSYNHLMGVKPLDYRNVFGGPAVVLMNNLEIIWQALSFFYGSKYSQKDIARCMYLLVKSFMFSIIVGNYDKSSHNWEVELTDKNLNLVPIFDNETTFSLEERRLILSTSTKDSFHYLTEVLHNFLCTSSSEYVDLFLEMFYSLDRNSINIAIDNVEKKIKEKIPDYIKENIVDAYLYNRILIYKELEKLNLDNGLESIYGR